MKSIEGSTAMAVSNLGSQQKLTLLVHMP
jgi:hypothetical protein